MENWVFVLFFIWVSFSLLRSEIVIVLNVLPLLCMCTEQHNHCSLLWCMQLRSICVWRLLELYLLLFNFLACWSLRGVNFYSLLLPFFVFDVCLILNYYKISSLAENTSSKIVFDELLASAARDIVTKDISRLRGGWPMQEAFYVSIWCSASFLLSH